MHRSLKHAWWLVEILSSRVRRTMWPRSSLFRLYFPLAQPRWVDTAHALDPSIAERMDRVPDYRPLSLPAGPAEEAAHKRASAPVERE